MKEVVSVLEDALGDVRLNITRSLVSLIFHHYVLDRVYYLILNVARGLKPEPAPFFDPNLAFDKKIC